METINPKQTFISEGLDLHYYFPREINDFLLYIKWFIKYQVNDAMQDAKSEKSIAAEPFEIIEITRKRIGSYLEKMQEDAPTFAYMLFQPTTRSFIVKCLLRFVHHSDCSKEFQNHVVSMDRKRKKME